MCCGQNVDRTCGCWFTEDGDTIVPYIVMPKAVAKEIKQTKFESMDDLEIRLQQPDVIQTGTAFLNKRKYEQMDKQIRSLWANMVPKIASYMMQKTGVDKLQQLIRELHHLILEYNGPQQCVSSSLTEMADLFVLEDLLQADEAAPKAVYKAPAPIVKRPKVVTAPPKPTPRPTLSPPQITALKTDQLQKLASTWQPFDIDAIIDYNTQWLQLQSHVDQLRALKKSPDLYAAEMQAFETPAQIIMEINRQVSKNKSLDDLISRLRSRELIPFSITIQDRINAEKAKRAEPWIQEEREIPGLVGTLKTLLTVSNDKATSTQALADLFNKYILPLLENARSDEQTMLLAYLMGIYKSDRLVAPAWQDDVWNNQMRRKSYREAMWKFMRYLLTKDATTYEEAWVAIENAKLNLLPLRGFDKKGNDGEEVPVAKQNKSVDAGEITDAANFQWASAGGGSCAFDALFNGLFKMPNTWLQKQIFAAENVVPFNNQKCPSDKFHTSVVADILFLQGKEIARQECQSRKVYYECIGIPVETDDPQYIMSRLLAFYNLQNRAYVFSIGDYKLSTVPGKQLQVLQPNISIPQNEQYEMFLFEVEEPLAPLQQRASVNFTIPNEIVINNTPASSMHLMTCFVTTGGHWLAYVRDINTKIWWKFDAIANPPYVKYDENTPAAVLGSANFEKPAAYLYVRKQVIKASRSDEKAAASIFLRKLTQLPRLHQQQKEFDLDMIKSKRNLVSAEEYDAAYNAVNGEDLKNWWDLIIEDGYNVKDLDLKKLTRQDVFGTMPPGIIRQFDLATLSWLIQNMLPDVPMPNTVTEMVNILNDERARFQLKRPIILETIEFRMNDDSLSIEHDLLLPLKAEAKHHWPVIAQNSVWEPVFTEMQLRPEDSLVTNPSVDYLHKLADIAKVMIHLENQEPVPVELFKKLKN
jgi:hypothetical protein